MTLRIMSLSSACRKGIAALVVLASAVSCGPPQNTAVASRSQVAGAVYTAKLLWTGPVYIDSFQALEGSSTAGAAGALIGEIVANGSRNQSRWTDLAREGAQLGSNAIEKRALGKQCQYLLSTTDVYLMQSVNPRFIIDDGRPSPEQELLQSRIESTEEQIQFLQLELSESITALEEDRGNEKLAEVADTIDKLIDGKIQVLEIMKRQIENAENKETEDMVITVLNPCRDFELGDKVLVLDAGFGNIILEKNEIGL